MLLFVVQYIFVVCSKQYIFITGPSSDTVPLKELTTPVSVKSAGVRVSSPFGGPALSACHGELA